MMVSLESGLLHLGSASTHRRSRKHKIINFTRSLRDLFRPPQGGFPFPPNKTNTRFYSKPQNMGQEVGSIAGVFTYRFEGWYATTLVNKQSVISL